MPISVHLQWQFPSPQLRHARRLFSVGSLLLCLCLGLSPAQAEQLYVVERERGKVAVLTDGALTAEIPELGDLSHATLKFYRGSAYVVSRDGWLSRIDLASHKVTARARVGKSAIGFTFLGDFVAVANYDPKEVVVLRLDLTEVKRLATGSRNVGIKAQGDRLVFALMDLDEIWVLSAKGGFEVEKRITGVGAMPFDALQSDDRYVVGFYKEPTVGILDLTTLNYSKLPLKTPEGEPILKIPHFGTWGVAGRRAFLPVPGAPRLYLVNLDTMACEKSLSLPGLPVFASVAPDQKTMAVNYSGDQENSVSLVDLTRLEVVQTVQAGQRVMHLRFSEDGGQLHLSSYFENQVKELAGLPRRVERTVAVPGPSGIFLVPSGKESP